MVVVAVVLALFFADCNAFDRRFPSHFKFGSATAAYQVEGAWNVSDKGESVWDRYVHEHPEEMVYGHGDVSADSYHQWKEDVRIAHELGLNFYRFSISWTRLLPTGFPTVISEAGKKYYNDLIDALLERGIEPVVTVYHWDTPQKFQDLGGWANPHMADWYADYARVVFTLFADRVKIWITINEPIMLCDGVYNMRFTAPRTMEQELGPFLCNKHVLIAHAKAWRIYDTEFRHKYHGKVSMTNNLLWMEPLAPEYKDLAELALQHSVSWTVLTPNILKRGGWPPSVEKVMAEYSKRQGHVRSRLPQFTKEEIQFIKGTYDFYAMNMYTARLVRPRKPEDGPGIWFITGSPEMNITLLTGPDWPVCAVKLMPAYPVGMRRHIEWLRKEYGKNLPILITENGYPTLERDFADIKRIDFLSEHLHQILLAIHEDGANILGYSVWSLIDNFEWMDGYRSRFGLYDVDFDDPKKTRTPRASAYFYAHLIKTRHLASARNHSLTHIKRKHKFTSSSSSRVHVYVWSNLMSIIVLTVMYCLRK